MSEEQTQEPEFPQAVEVMNQEDWFLQSMIEVIINRGVEIGVTMSVGGSIVSGILISGKTYFEELGAVVAASSKEEGDVSEMLGNSWKEYRRLYEKPEDAGDDWEEPRAAYIHLRNARYYAPGNHPIPDGGVLWRGRLSSVDAFSIGNFSG